ncbi:MAG: DUF4282 domain-containing protein [Tepidisphaeraceae bacterium]|jgi:hypothetical protein
MSDDVGEFLAFRKMITPLIIQIIFWIGVVGCVIEAINFFTYGGSAVIFGLFVLIVGPLVVRIYCELLIVIFRIYSELVAIRTGAHPEHGGAPGFPVNVPPPPQH